MVNYYKILRISSKASNSEIKSAYRRLARKLHPDLNGGSQRSSDEFANVAKAYEVLGNPASRAEYDKILLTAQFENSFNDGSVFSTENAHAKRWRRMVYERRYNEIIDRMIADERRETMALQKVLFPTVALFMSICFVAILRPMFWANSHPVGKIVLISLFIAGIVHLISRLRSGFERYTYSYENLHDSILELNESENRPYTRTAAIAFLVTGCVVSLGIGVFVGNFAAIYIGEMPNLFSPTLPLEAVFYPPIIVLFVDAMHSLVSRLDS